MPEPVNVHGLTELHTACYEGDLEWVQDCLGDGFNVHARDKNGYTPLHWVVDMGLVGKVAGQREGIIVALIEAGADVNARDDNGESLLELARRVEAYHLIPLLVEHGAL